MRGLVLDGIKAISYRGDLAEPGVQSPTDAVVQVQRAGLCGSDLHPYLGRERVRFGVIPGHEVVGVVAETGPRVVDFAVGDRVVVPFTTSCGSCTACRRGLTSRCSRGQLFGFAPADDPSAPALPGGQAEYVRVPLADTTLIRVPAGMSDEDAVLLADVLPTGWYAVTRAEPTAGEPFAVVGLGAVGLCAVTCALTMKGDVTAFDPVAERRERARLLGASVHHPDEAAALLGQMPAVIDASGSADGQRLAFSLLRPGGTLSVVAVQTEPQFAFTPVDAYDVNASVRFGRAPVRAVLDHLIGLLTRGELALPTTVVTDPAVPLSEGPATYERFATRRGGIVKALFAP